MPVAPMSPFVPAEGLKFWDSGSKQGAWMIRRQEQASACGPIVKWKFLARGIAGVKAHEKYLRAFDSGPGWEVRSSQMWRELRSWHT